MYAQEYPSDVFMHLDAFQMYPNTDRPTDIFQSF